MANQRICDICKKNLADISFKVKQSNKLWSLSKLWSDYKTIDVCNECGNKLLGIINLNTAYPKLPPCTGSSIQKTKPLTDCLDAITPFDIKKNDG